MTARAPTALKVLRNTARPDRANKAEPKPRPLALNARPPHWLYLSPVAIRAWRTIVPILRGMGVATTADRVALGMLCDALAEYVTARDIAREAGATFETTNEHGGMMVRAHPAVGIASDAWRRVRLMLNDYGLTAAARSKVSSASIENADPFDQWAEAAR
jgi:P27 family predicted phage terminase small subunit